MLLVTFSDGAGARVGALDRAAGEVVDLSQVDPVLPLDMLGLIALGEAGLAHVRAAVASGKSRLPLARVTLKAPIPRPARNILCVGKNYREHALEIQSTPIASADKDGVPEVPIVFTKWPSTVIAPHEPIPSHRDPTQSADYEGELGVIIGKGGRDIKHADVMRHIYGYTIINDVTSRRLQKQHHQWFLGKSLDGFCPMGPAILVADESIDIRTLRLETRVNGELRQNASIGDLIFDVPTLVETLSHVISLAPGDIISTGTPAGVGMALKPPQYLKAGDTVAITVEPIGTLENPVT
jgi:2-keto-4-pentenoate hydratase/2-oxohepta-3-ene-1,7-dioic acid hydratase in catechol pathway